MCKWGTATDVVVKIPADLSSTHQNKWKPKPIDSCIADLVRALQNGGVDMRGSCCGHGKNLGHINLQDGRTLFVVSEEWSDIIWENWAERIRADFAQNPVQEKQP